MQTRKTTLPHMQLFNLCETLKTRPKPAVLKLKWVTSKIMQPALIVIEGNGIQHENYNISMLTLSQKDNS